ncbi:unnamed protein product [Mytilus coruscus]|uniref:Integrase p58-like C-terminal domain-containing protein n=1 Tax=Mytilus coruscus TaxID=42192 RepID=A0A6J8DX00_MYTCO|nr:unnamed protein product [Mytilus coruscus]
MPPAIKPTPSNIWVWELRERLEDVHALVRKHSDGASVRQKTYHDRRMSWERFEIDDKVYVYFPQKKKGCTPKFTSFWRGPCQILRKVSEVLYQVDCGRKNQPQIVHFDRLRKKVAQSMRVEDSCDASEAHETDIIEVENVEEVEELVQESCRPIRNIRPPARFDDFVVQIIK